MQDFSFKDAALSGYRLLRARPMVAVWWFLWSLICGMGLVAAMVWMIGPQMMALREIQAAGPGNADPGTMMALSRPILGFQFLFTLPFALVTGAVSLGAANRAILRPQGAALGYLRFGPDEFRLLVTTLVTGGILFLVYMVVVIVATIALVIGAGPGALRAGLGSVSLTALLPAIGVALIGAAGLVFLAVKLSLAASQTVAEKSIRIFGSWGLTNRRFWKVLGVYVVAGLPVLVLGLGLVAFTMATNMAGAGPIKPHGLMQAMQPDVTSMATAFAPRYLLIYGLQAVIRTLGMAALIAPAAYICQALLVPATDDDED